MFGLGLGYAASKLVQELSEYAEGVTNQLKRLKWERPW